MIVFTAAANGFTREDVESGGWFESSSLDASDSPEGAVTEAREGAASEVAAEEARASACFGAASAAPRGCALDDVVDERLAVDAASTDLSVRGVVLDAGSVVHE